MRRVVSFMIACVLICSASFAANEFDYCMVCHGATGNGNVAIKAPKIAGLEPWYVARQLEAFASGMRGRHADDVAGHEMASIGERLKQEQRIDAAVQFVGSFAPEPIEATVHGDVAKGRELYAACAGCHGVKGEGNQALQAPALASRSDWYLVTQLNNYRLGRRSADARDIHGAQMRAIVATLPDEKAVADVVAFINTFE